jgi:hypothetical protein
MLSSNDTSKGQPAEENRVEDKSDGEGCTKAQVHNNTGTQEKPKRTTRGYRLRDDLVKRCKRIAVEEERKLYEVMEEALEEYLARRGQ